MHRIQRRHEIGGTTTQLFKPELDVRYSKDERISHDDSRVDADPVSNLDDLKTKLEKNTGIYLFDELQFFHSEIISFTKALIHEGKEVAVAGLNFDYRGEIFFMKNQEGKITKRSIYDLENIADRVIRLSAVCTHEFPSSKRCGEEANFCQRFSNKNMTIIAPYDAETIELGAKETYAARCSRHFKFYKENGL